MIPKEKPDRSSSTEDAGGFREPEPENPRAGGRNSLRRPA